MKYSELIHFDPINTVIQVIEANNYSAAQRLVETYVISERMAERIEDVVLPHLQFEEPKDNKALLVVGNYGTGKSHLMSVISTVAEYAEAVGMLQHDPLRLRMEQIAGKFLVCRTEIGASTMPLRELIFQAVANFLEDIGVDYAFPPMDKVTNNKDCLLEMMALFSEQYPEQGFLVVVDELLDYLRSRKEQDIILDLNFLREIGEICKLTRFRFIAGVQESLFDSSSFQFVADTLRRVKDRFEQVRIAREDVAFVVANRLLKKNDRQKALVRAHLERFYPLYANMAERSEQFVSLFPVHPTYLEVFEKVYVAEKREVLKTISETIGKLLAQDVPERETGLISFDSYWQAILENSALRSTPEVRSILEKSQRLEGIVETSFPAAYQIYKPAALRIIRALSVYRLTTGDINSPIGLTAAALRDGLCLHLDMPEEDPEFLLTTVETVLREIRKTVSGQFISVNKENEQYYLDPNRDIDYDSEIEKKAGTLAEDTLNRYYFHVLTHVLDRGESMVTGHRAWEYELEWLEKRTSRIGWLFFGAPNERSTAQPPRDFYVYFLKPFGIHEFEDEKRQDEVFYKLTKTDDTFNEALRQYAGAMEMVQISQGEGKRAYTERAAELRKNVTKWVNHNLLTSYEVLYQGVNHKFTSLVKSTAGKETRDLVNAAAAGLLAVYFKEQTPDYPTFALNITTKNREQYALDAIRWLGTNVKTDVGAKILDSLELLEGNAVKAAHSRYAKKEILDKLTQKVNPNVLNRKEIIRPLDSIEYSLEYRLEPEWIAVMLVALVYDGSITLSLPGNKYDASNLEELARRTLDDIRNFNHVERPKDLPLRDLIALFDFLGLPSGLIVNPATRDEAVAAMLKEATARVEELVILQQQVTGGIQSFGISFLTEAEKDQAKRQLDAYKAFLESLQVYKTAAKLKNFRYSADEIKGYQAAVDKLVRLKGLLELKQQTDGLANYISQAELALPAGHSWVQALRTLRQETGSLVSGGNLDTTAKQEILTKLRGLKQAYIQEYLRLHKLLRLDVHDDDKKKKLLQHEFLQKLNRLKEIDLMPRGQLQEWVEELGRLKPCYNLLKEELENTPVCPHCALNLSREAEQSVFGRTEHLEEALEQMLRQWTETLLENLEDPMVRSNVALLSNLQARARVEAFLAGRDLPEDLDSEFIHAVREVLSGLVKVNLTLDEMKTALLGGISPCTVEELKNRFNKYVDGQVRGKDTAKVRIILE